MEILVINDHCNDVGLPIGVAELLHGSACGTQRSKRLRAALRGVPLTVSFGTAINYGRISAWARWLIPFPDLGVDPNVEDRDYLFG